MIAEKLTLENFRNYEKEEVNFSPEINIIYGKNGAGKTNLIEALYSFSYDYPYIFSAFMHDYRINIRTIPYMHWWEFRMLFDGLSNDNEIKQRIMYRGIDLNDVKDKDERKRIMKIQREIKLPDDILTDYDIGDAFEW